MTPPRPIHYWRPARRTRTCLACDRREQIRTDAFGPTDPVSLCTRHWTDYANRLPAFDRERLTEGQPPQ